MRETWKKDLLDFLPVHRVVRSLARRSNRRRKGWKLVLKSPRRRMENVACAREEGRRGRGWLVSILVQREGDQKEKERGTGIYEDVAIKRSSTRRRLRRLLRPRSGRRDFHACPPDISWIKRAFPFRLAVRMTHIQRGFVAVQAFCSTRDESLSFSLSLIWEDTNPCDSNVSFGKRNYSR